MRALVLVVTAWVGFSLPAPAEAAKAVARPPAVLAKITLGAPSGLDGLRAFADGVQPGIGTFLDARTLLTAWLALPVDGLDLTGTVHVLYVATRTDAGLVAFARVADASLLPADASKRDGWALVGAAPLVKAAAPWAHRALTGRAPQDLVITAYPDALLKQHAGQLHVAQLAIATQRGTPGGDMLAMVFGGMLGIAADTVAVTLRFDATADRLGATLTLAPKLKSKLAAFVKAQRPSDFQILDRLAAGPAPYLLAARLALGPYRAAGHQLASTVFASLGNAALRTSTTQLLAAIGSDSALAMTLDPAQGPTMRALYTVDDPAAADAALAAMHGALASPRTVTLTGVTSTSVAVPGIVIHDGIMVRAYDTTTTPATFGTGTQRSHVALADRAVVVVTDNQATRSIDAARGKGTPLQLAASQRALFEVARARKDSIALTLDAAAVLGATPGAKLTLPAGSDFLLSVGFANRAAEVYLEVPAVLLRSLVQRSLGGTP